MCGSAPYVKYIYGLSLIMTVFHAMTELSPVNLVGYWINFHHTFCFPTSSVEFMRIPRMLKCIYHVLYSIFTYRNASHVLCIY